MAEKPLSLRLGEALKVLESDSPELLKAKQATANKILKGLERKAELDQKSITTTERLLKMYRTRRKRTTEQIKITKMRLRQLNRARF